MQQLFDSWPDATENTPALTTMDEFSDGKKEGVKKMIWHCTLHSFSELGLLTIVGKHASPFGADK